MQAIILRRIVGTKKKPKKKLLMKQVPDGGGFVEKSAGHNLRSWCGWGGVITGVANGGWR